MDYLQGLCMKGQRHYLISKGRDKFVFLYDKGNEHELMSAVLDMIFNESLDFDWPDATFVAFDMIDKLVEEREGGEFHQDPYIPSSR